MEPPFITLKQPYGGFGLKTKTSEAARRRIDGLLADCAVEIAQPSLDLDVTEPASRALVEAMVGPLDRDVAARGTSGLPLPADELVRAHGHVHAAHAADAWRAWGVPVSAGVIQRRTDTWIEWRWRAEGADAAPLYDPWCRFVDRHQALMIDDYSTALGVRGRWTFRLVSAGGAIAEPPYPPSRVTASLRGRHASAFLDLVFPYASLTPEMIADFERVCDALGMKLPAGALRVSSPTRSGNRKLGKLT